MSKIVTVKMPDIGEGVVEGQVIEWLKKPGEAVKQDEPVVVLMTDKATVELPSPCPGVLHKQYYKAGETAYLDQPLYDINADELAQTRAQASPATRKLAKDLSIDIQDIEGTGKEGRVTKEDVLKSGGTSSEMPLIGIRQLMAQSMAESKQNIPHFSYFEQVDATRLIQLRRSFQQEAAKQEIHVTYMPFIIKALSLSLTQFPIVNSSLDIEKKSVVFHKNHNIGIAITTERGLIVPVLKEVQNQNLEQVIKAYEELKNRALSSKLVPQDMQEGTISVSNFGVLGGGGLWATPIILHPQVAILAVARIQKQPTVRNGNVVTRDILNLSWSFDHRIIDGDTAAKFSHHFSTILQNPSVLI